eukprot:14158761-Ditylum_brightwellii.AAC.1
MSQTGFVIMYAGCPVFWRSKLLTAIALSTAEGECIALSSALQDVIPFMYLMEEQANSHKFSPWTKHIALKYHHFRNLVQDGKLDILTTSSAEQTADIFTKPLQDQ